MVKARAQGVSSWQIQPNLYSQLIHCAARMSQWTAGIASLSSEVPTLSLALLSMALIPTHKPINTLLVCHWLSSAQSLYLFNRPKVALCDDKTNKPIERNSSYWNRKGLSNLVLKLGNPAVGDLFDWMATWLIFECSRSHFEMEILPDLIR